MNKKKLIQTIQLLFVQRKILELEIELSGKIPKEELRDSVRAIEIAFEGDGEWGRDRSVIMDSLEMSDKRFEKILTTLKNVGDISESKDRMISRVHSNNVLSLLNDPTESYYVDMDECACGAAHVKESNTYKFKFKIKSKQVIRSIDARSDTQAIKIFARECGMGKFSCEVNDGHKFTHKGGWRDKK